MQNLTPGERPQNDAGYLEMMTAVMLGVGIEKPLCKVAENILARLKVPLLMKLSNGQLHLARD